MYLWHVMDSKVGREHSTFCTTTPSVAEEHGESKDLCTDASSEDREIPELIDFLQEINRLGFKDISVDGEVPSTAACSVENCELDHDMISCLLNSEVEKSDNLMEEAPGTASSSSNMLGSSSEHEFAEDTVAQFGAENWLSKVELGFGAGVDTTDSYSTSQSALEVEKRLRVEEWGTNDSTLCSSTGHRRKEVYDQVLGREVGVLTSMVSSASKALSDNSISSEVAFTSNNEDARSNTHDYDSSEPKVCDREEILKTPDGEHLHTEHLSKHEGELPESLTMSRQNSTSLFIPGDCSFSTAGPLPGSLSNSGAVPLSRSISLRSNSSTNSRGSFAFSVLPKEWHGSPIRMVETDRRHLRRHWCCCMGFICCKF